MTFHSQTFQEGLSVIAFPAYGLARCFNCWQYACIHLGTSLGGEKAVLLPVDLFIQSFSLEVT